MKPDKALELALDAAAMNSTADAAKKHGRTQRSVQHAVEQVTKDPVLSLTFAQKKKQMAEELHDLRVGFMKAALAEMLNKIPTGELRDVTGAYKIVADHQEVAIGVMNDGGQHYGRTEPDKDPATVAQDDQPVPVPCVEYAAPRTH